VSYMYTNRLRTGLSLAQPDSDPWTQSYGYDAARRLTSVASPAGNFSYLYDPVRNLQVARLSLPNGAFITNQYDSVDRLLSTALKSSSAAVLNSHQYTYNAANERTAQTFTFGNYDNYNYDPMGQLVGAVGKEPGGGTNRLQEQLGYAYDLAGNLAWRTNNALLESFGVNSVNELTTESPSGTLTVAGTTTSPATNVTVNTSNAVLYVDRTFASSNQNLVNGNNSFTAIAKDVYGRRDTNTITCYLPASVSYVYERVGPTIDNQD
jgi:YD repeat-containing protein